MLVINSRILYCYADVNDLLCKGDRQFGTIDAPPFVSSMASPVLGGKRKLEGEDETNDVDGQK